MAVKSSQELDLISIQFKHLHSLLNQAEVKVKESFCNLKSEKERTIRKSLSGIAEAKNAKLFAERNVRDNELKSNILYGCETKIAKLKDDKLRDEQLSLNVIWSDLGFEALALKISSITTAYAENLELPDLTRPSCSGGAISDQSGEGKLVWPNHLAIEEETANIYISDWKGGCIQIFNKYAQFLRLFKHTFYCPRAILVKNSKLYVIENNKQEKFTRFKIFSIKDDSQLIVSNGEFGSGRGEVGIAGSFDITPEEKWYISEPDNQRIQILNADLTHHSFFFNFSGICDPIQVRIRGDVFVLGKQEKSTKIYLLSRKNGSLIRLIDLSGVIGAMYFALLGPHWLIVSDYNEHCLKIFNFEGELLLSGERLSHPKGIEVLKNGRIASLSMKQFGHCLNIY